MPSLSQTMNRLKALGTAQNRKVYARHGAMEPMFGVSFANLEATRKAIGTDHSLARRLWETRNMDAQNLAVMVADVAAFNTAELNRWARESQCSLVVDSFVKYVVQHVPVRYGKIEQWIQSSSENVSRAGWQTLATTAVHDPGLTDKRLRQYLATIEAGIHGAKNRTKEAMNNALIAIGGRSPTLARTAIATAKRIGPVDVDHGETYCKTPDAVSYIERMAKRARTKRVAGKK